MHSRYQEWIHHVFDHPSENRPWYEDSDAPEFIASQEETVKLINLTFRNCREDLRIFSDAQVAQGLYYLITAYYANHFSTLRSNVVPLELRISAISSIFDLYQKCFTPRCSENLSHLDEPALSKLNGVCYMFWDICTLSGLRNCEEKQPLADACFSVLDRILTLGHLACQEAAIHGYGEFQYSYPERVHTEITSHLKTGIIHPKLIKYAMDARDGLIQ